MEFQLEDPSVEDGSQLNLSVAEGSDEFKFTSLAEAPPTEPPRLQPAAIPGGGSAIPASTAVGYTGGSITTPVPTDQPPPYRGGSVLKGRATSTAVLVFPTSSGKAISQSNVRNRVLAKTVERANERLSEARRTPLPGGLTPHSLRRTFASLMYAIGEPAPVVMQELGHTHPARALRIYAAAMRRDEDENEALRALVDGGLSQFDRGAAQEAPASA